MNREPSTGIIRLSASPALAAWVVAAGVCTMILLFCYLPLAAALGGASAVLLHAWQMLRRHALRQHPDALVALQISDGAVSYRLRSGAWSNGAILAGGMVTPWLTVARWRATVGKPRHRTLVLCADAVDAENYRRLRVYLRWGWRDDARDPDLIT